jgi:hypothetical protein
MISINIIRNLPHLPGAENFATIRAYLSTMRKNNRRIFPAIAAALFGQAIIPAPTF